MGITSSAGASAGRSSTVSTSGPATFHNQGQSSFLVRKLFVLGPRGLSVWPAIAEAENNYNYLVSLETDFDGMPLVGSLVRSIARNQLDEVRGEARRQTAQKVAIRALHELDEKTQARLIEAGNGSLLRGKWDGRRPVDQNAYRGWRFGKAVETL